MKLTRHFTRSLFALLFAFFIFVPSLQAQETEAPNDYSGDVPYVPTPQNVVDKMLEMAQVGPKDRIVDLGSGDGRIVLTAVTKKGARGRGIELNEGRVKYSQKAAERLGVTDRATFKQEDIFETKISDATVVTMYLLTSVNMRMKPRLLNELRPGTRIVSHAFDMGDWEPDKEVVMDTGQRIYYWVVPAKVEGTWIVNTAPENKSIGLQLQQQYQKVSGFARVNGRQIPIQDGKVEGNKITFSLGTPNGTQSFQGQLANGKITGQLQTLQAKASSSNKVLAQ